MQHWTVRATERLLLAYSCISPWILKDISQILSDLVTWSQKEIYLSIYVLDEPAIISLLNLYNTLICIFDLLS